MVPGRNPWKTPSEAQGLKVLLDFLCILHSGELDFSNSLFPQNLVPFSQKKIPLAWDGMPRKLILPGKHGEAPKGVLGGMNNLFKSDSYLKKPC